MWLTFWGGSVSENRPRPFKWGYKKVDPEAPTSVATMHLHIARPVPAPMFLLLLILGASQLCDAHNEIHMDISKMLRKGSGSGFTKVSLSVTFINETFLCLSGETRVWKTSAKLRLSEITDWVARMSEWSDICIGGNPDGRIVNIHF